MAPSIDARMLVDAFPTATLVLDLDGIVVAANALALTTFAHEAPTDAHAARTEAHAARTGVGRKFKDFLADDWRGVLTRAIADMKQERRAQLVSLATGTDTGVRRAWDILVQPIHDDRGSLTGVLVVAHHDGESDRLWSAKLDTANAQIEATNEELEARLEELRAAHRSHEERNRFLAMLAHELRNPLAGIRNALYLLHRRHAGQGDRVAERALRVAERQSHNQARLLNDLLDVSRIVLGKIVLRVEPTDLVAVVQQALETIDFDIRTRAHTLHTDVPEHPVYVMGDPVRLEQVVANLLNNAVKYTPAGGRLGLTMTTTSDTATLTITDSGVGIDAKLLDRIFDLFTQGDASRARAAGGLGIGLTVARHLATLHGGTIEARSAGRGHGTTFTVSLPLTDEVLTPAGQPPAAGDAARPRRILIVDDNRDARDMLRTILELEGHHVQDAADGVHAVRLAIESTPDVAIIDIGLPEIDGYEVAARIRKRVGDAVRLIALTGYGDPEARDLAMKAGFDEHLVKPVDPDRLAEFIRAM